MSKQPSRVITFRMSEAEAAELEKEAAEQGRSVSDLVRSSLQRQGRDLPTFDHLGGTLIVNSSGVVAIPSSRPAGGQP